MNEKENECYMLILLQSSQLIMIKSGVLLGPVGLINLGPILFCLFDGDNLLWWFVF